jgi:ubiquinone/menaquinone biosynthesis C-methylase UbiE
MSQPNNVSETLEYAKSIGYSDEELKSLPQGLVCRGCGTPVVLADLKEGETVLDLGAGVGPDAFLAAQRVGNGGRVIGIDTSVETVEKANRCAAEGNYKNIVFKIGDMANLPVENGSVDVVISNCVINYSGDHAATFKEIFRCLKHGGRMVVADLVAEGEFSGEVLEDKVWGEWLASAVGKKEYLTAIQEAGFSNMMVAVEKPSGSTIIDDP